MNYKRFTFPAFEYNDIKDQISIKGGEISWKLFHDVFEKNNLLDANLRKAQKITHKALKLGNCKQNISVVLAIFHESTSAALHAKFLNRLPPGKWQKCYIAT